MGVVLVGQTSRYVQVIDMMPKTFNPRSRLSRSKHKPASNPRLGKQEFRGT
jgi:hypothetical protein